MREIKFRAWDKFKKEWIHEPIIDGANGKMMGFNLLDASFQRHFSDDEITLVYSTGLKDVEQFEEPKELFTGDIVKMHQFLFDGEEFEDEIIGVLVYDEDAAAVCLTEIRSHDIQRHMGYGTDANGFKGEQIPVCLFTGLHETSWTYLGNIYENPELLEV